MLSFARLRKISQDVSAKRLRERRTLCEAPCMSADEPLIGAEEAAELLGVHRATLLRWAAAGKLDIIHKGRGVNGAVILSRSQVLRLARERLARESA